MRFQMSASVGNSDGLFDAAYQFGNATNGEAQMSGTPEEIGAEVARYLSSLTPEDCREMQYGTQRFFIEFIVTPDESIPSDSSK